MEKEIAVFNDSMFGRAESESRVQSVMNSVHEIKAYNANLKDWIIDPNLAWKFRIKLAHTWDLDYIDWNFKFNPLSICKVKSWIVYMLNDFWDVIIDESGKEKKSMFYTNEFDIYTKKTWILWFKWNGKVVWYYFKEDLEKMLKSKRIQMLDQDWNRSEIKENPFYKASKDKAWLPYHDTEVTDTYVMYWIFIWGKYDWEYFKMYLNNNAFWKTYDKDKGKIQAEEWSLQFCTYKGLEDWNKIRTERGKSPVTSIAFDQLDITAKIEEISIWEKEKKIIYVTRFTYDNLTWYRTDNTNDVEFIRDLQHKYLIQEFGWIKEASVIDFSVPNLAVFTWEIKTETNKQIETSEEITEADVETIFEDNPKALEVRNEAKKGKAPF